MASVTNRKDPGEKLKNVMDAIADHVGAMPDAEVLGDAAADGLDVKAEGERVRAVLIDGIVRAKKQRLRIAQDAHRKAVAELATRTARLPEGPAERRALLARVLNKRPEIRDAITLQHRSFAEASDDYVESTLKHLDALGLLDDEPDSKS